MLSINGLTKRFNDVVALDGLDLEARPGRILGFLGPERGGQDDGDAGGVRTGQARRR